MIVMPEFVGVSRPCNINLHSNAGISIVRPEFVGAYGPCNRDNDCDAGVCGWMRSL